MIGNATVKTDYDVIVAGGGPAGVGYLYSLIQLMSNYNRYMNQFQGYIPDKLKELFQNHKVDVSVCFIKGPRPTNQFVAGWDTPYDELKPFGFHVADYARHYSKILEWEFPFTKFRYESPYCSIDHLKFIDDMEKRIQSKITVHETTVCDVKFSKECVSCKLASGEKINSKLLVDAMGYQSIINKKFQKNNHSPIYQMLLWKFPKLHGYDLRVNNIWFKPAELFNNSNYRNQFGKPFDVNDFVAGWFHPLHDGVIIGASKYLYHPIPDESLVKMLTPYLETYIKIRNLKPEGEKQIIRGIGVLHNPHHHLDIPRLLQIGDARRISRPATGYGFIPGLWNGFYGALATLNAFTKNNFSTHVLDGFAMKWFNFNYQLNYTWSYVIQLFYMKGNWDNVQQVFTVIQKILPKLKPGFFDRLTMSTFIGNDANTGVIPFLGHVLFHPQMFFTLPTDIKLDIIQQLMVFTKLKFNPCYDHWKYIDPNNF